MWQHWLNLILGIWIVASAYMGMTPENLTMNYTIVGAAVVVFAGWGALMNQKGYDRGGATNRPSMRT